jgi:hypothetical protein
VAWAAWTSKSTFTENHDTGRAAPQSGSFFQG